MFYILIVLIIVQIESSIMGLGVLLEIRLKNPRNEAAYLVAHRAHRERL